MIAVWSKSSTCHIPTNNGWCNTKWLRLCYHIPWWYFDKECVSSAKCWIHKESNQENKWIGVKTGRRKMWNFEGKNKIPRSSNWLKWMQTTPIKGNSNIKYTSPDEHDNVTSIPRLGKLLPNVYPKYT